MIKLFSGRSTISHPAAILLMLATAVLWSLGGLMIKLVDCHPLAIAGVRSAVASIFLLILIRRPHFTWSFPQIAGAISLAATFITFVMATKFTTAANAILLQYTAPIYVSLLGLWLLKEKVKLLDIITMVLVLGGMVLFLIDGLVVGGLAGDLLGIAAGVSFACFFVFTRMQKHESPINTVLLGNILTALVGVPFITLQYPDLYGWIDIALMGIIQLGIPYALYSIAIKRITALEAVLTSAIEPILNPLWVLLVLGEKPGQWALAGGLIVLVSVTVRGIISARNANMADRS